MKHLPIEVFRNTRGNIALMNTDEGGYDVVIELSPDQADSVCKEIKRISKEIHEDEAGS